MKLRATLLFVLATTLAGGSVVAPATIAAAEPNSAITILYDAFGTDAAMKKDWGFSALVEIAGKRIIFDTGNDPDHALAARRSQRTGGPRCDRRRRG
jgi:7,8-dihydropterin-6-yl-methyl-4-(beta-D-ribofuranosyl)aminobenzene 5'-phosphate synthase